MKINTVLRTIERIIEGLASEGGRYATGADAILAGDIDIIDITLQSEDGNRQFSLMSICKTFEIFESILSPVIFAEFNIADASGIHETFPIIGEEYINITFKTPGAETTSNYLLRVNKLKDKTVSATHNLMTYTLACVSAEVMHNSTKHVSRRFNGNVSDMVRDIVTEELGSEKKLTIDPTHGIREELITRMEPLKAIDYLRRKAYSNQYISSSFVFFENKHGYHFTTIEKLMHDGQRQFAAGASDKIFFFDRNAGVDNSAISARNILAYNQLVFTDAVSRLQSGSITNRVSRLDLVTGNYTEIVYTDNEVADRYKTIDENAAGASTSSFTRTHGRDTAVTTFVTTNGDRPDDFAPDRIGISQSFINKITQNIVHIQIYGDSEISVGDTIRCSFPPAEDTDTGSGVSRLDSGNYLVAKVRHMVLNTDRPQHTMVLELIKGSLTDTV
jgi:hypothetical protein